ncbi:MAG: alkaline phosphatase family protein [Clostridia bacterium]|nr:alkaline phosphatase family protein [Clostridia bacterium]
MKIVRPNYDDCLTNLSNSILKHFGCKTFHNSLSDIDEILKENNSKNVVVVLLDGMGSNIMDRLLPDNAFLRKNRKRAFLSVFPPTTVAATTSFLSGLNPSEHGWLGWEMYVPKERKIVETFTNCIPGTTDQIADYNLMHKYYSYKSIIDMINEKYEAHVVSPYQGESYGNLNDMCNKVINLCDKPGKKFIYAYFEDPDSTEHVYGTDSRENKLVYKNLNQKMETMASKLEDTTLIIIADHGHINSSPIQLKEDDKEFYDMLKKRFSLEPRCANLFVKQESKYDLEDLFTYDYEKSFILYSKKQVIDKKIFGPGKEHRYFKDSLGDYMAIATGDKYFRYDGNSKIYKSHHAGMTEDEMYIPLIVVTKK